VEYRNLGNTGLMVSELCLGTQNYGWNADERTSFDIMTAAYEAGINFFDTADMYSWWAPGNSGGESEAMIGKWLRTGVASRSDMVICTKVRGPMGKGPNDIGLSRRHVIAAAEASLRRLGVDHIDLYLLHWVDETVPIEETLGALDYLVRRGDVLYVGCSNFPAWRLMQALWTSDDRNLVRFACVEPHYNAVQREEYEREVEFACRDYGLGVITYSPLAEGFLTGRYSRSQPLPSSGRLADSRYNLRGLMSEPSSWEILECLEQLGNERGKSISQMAIGWLLSRPTVTCPIVGPRTLDQLHDNLGAVGLRLTDEELAAIDNVYHWRQRFWDMGIIDVDNAKRR